MKNEFFRIVVLAAISLSVICVCTRFMVSRTASEQVSSKRVTGPEINLKTLGERKATPTGVIIGPLNRLLILAKSLTSNYGLAIILMTFVLRLMLTPLQYISIKSAKKMKEIQPQLVLIKEKFCNDPSKVREETMKLFKEKSVNPVMGFLPVLLQMPLFFSLYKLLRMSPNIIGANFGGWLTDLSLPDPFFILPILAGIFQLVVMFYGANESHEPKMAGKFKFIMSAVFTGVMLKMPAALLLYTITSSVSSVIEKGVISRIIG